MKVENTWKLCLLRTHAILFAGFVLGVRCCEVGLFTPATHPPCSLHATVTRLIN